MNSVIENLKFDGYILEDNFKDIPEIKGVYCAYACTPISGDTRWNVGDIVYFGKAEDGESTIRARVVAHMDTEYNARKTLKRGEKLAYSYAQTDNAGICERALIAHHKDLPRLANDKLTGDYEGPMVYITTSGKSKGMDDTIIFLGDEEL